MNVDVDSESNVEFESCSVERINELAEMAYRESQIAQLLLNPFTDEVCSANLEACKLLSSDIPTLRSTKASELFFGNFPEFVVFTQEGFELGRAYGDSLMMKSPETSERRRVEIHAQPLVVSGTTLFQLHFQDAEVIEALRDHSEAQKHYRSGLQNWKRVEKVFQEFERENRLILDAAGEGIYGVDAHGLTTFLNPAAEQILGWSAEELLGKNMHYVIHSKRCDGSHYHAEHCPIFRAFREGVVTFVDNEVFWSKEGKPIDVEYTSTPIKDAGENAGAVIIFRDVTEKRRSDQKLREALAEVERLKQRLELENAYLQEEINSEFNHHHIVGKSAAIQNILQKIEMVAPADATVLIVGESGTGKELIARAIHESSERSARSLIRVNCAAIPEALFESEFFGHSKGAFTGATSDRPGRFELADCGTIFLDEVGEIPLLLQGKLLRVLQEQTFERVGESKTRKVDVRIIAATNRDLKELVKQGDFREDLYFRLNVFPIVSVPLRERVDDIPLLAQHFLARAATRAAKSDLKISLRQLEYLKSYNWPGNIRELENIIERQVILARGDTLRFDELDVKKVIVVKSNDAILVTESEKKNQDKLNIVAALKKTRGKIFGEGGAAELLGVKPTTLASRIKKYQIKTSRFKVE